MGDSARLDRIVLAYSGGLDTTVAIPWLRETYDVEVVTLTMDVGQAGELEGVRDRALASGASRAHVIDARAEFAETQVLSALQACAVYQGRYPLATALSRPLIAKHLVDIARIEGASAIAHGSTGKGDDQHLLDVSIRALAPDLTVVAPARLSRPEAVAYAAVRGLRLPASINSRHSIDTNLWGRSIACGELEDAWQEPPEEVFTLTRSPADAPEQPANVDIDFDQGVPVRINGVTMALVDLIKSLETIAGSHGVGRIDKAENGLGFREVHEAPAAVALHTAHLELQRCVTPRDLGQLAADLAVTYADLVYNGLWFTQMREALDALVANVQARVTGTVRLELSKGSCRAVGRQSPHALSSRVPDEAGVTA